MHQKSMFSCNLNSDLTDSVKDDLQPLATVPSHGKGLLSLKGRGHDEQ